MATLGVWELQPPKGLQCWVVLALTAYTWFPYAITPTPLLLLLIGAIRDHWFVVGLNTSAELRH